MAGAATVAVHCAHPAPHSFWRSSTVFGQLLMAIALAGTGAPLGAWMVQICPASTRFSSVAVGYNTALALFGGTAPLVGAALMKGVSSTAAPGTYRIVSCSCGGVAC